METIDFKVNAKTPITFHLRMVGNAEEKQLRQRFLGLTDAEMEEKLYSLNVAVLSELAVTVPEEMQSENKEAFSSPSAAIQEYFREKSPSKEQTADVAARAYFAKLAPEVVFI